jgi:hypothetical protein
MVRPFCALIPFMAGKSGCEDEPKSTRESAAVVATEVRGACRD